ncbi:MAG: hypothetical protein EOP38_10185 [Rubrivivax sp.]|nr:MAG: hypothetical protein EOP38_10185 [Rubrivivax sp.]
MLARLMAFSVWLLLGASVAYWGLQLFARPLPMPASVMPAGEGQPGLVDLGRLLGVAALDPAPAAVDVAVSSRLRLLGVVAPKNARAAQAGEGVALIDVDGVPRTVRVGAVVDGDLRLLRVDARSASLGLAGQAATQVLQLSPPPAPTTGALPAASPSPIVLGGNPPGAGPMLPPQQPQPPMQPNQTGAPPAYGLPLAASASSGLRNR